MASTDPSFVQPPARGRELPSEYPPASTVTNLQLLKWMFRFLRPVKLLALLACMYLAMWVGSEVLAVRQTARAIDQIKHLHLVENAQAIGFWSWFRSTDPEAALLRGILLQLTVLTAAMTLLRYLREVSSAKMSMQLVFYIREAVYDKLQRVGFKFHDVISSGQLINRALTDLQHVRMFVQSALLTSLEIVLIVGGYILLVLSRDPWVAVLALLPLPIWTVYILNFSRRVQPASKAVMEAEDRNVSIITENIAGVHVVKAFATEHQEIDKYDRNSEEYQNRVMRRIGMYATFTPTMRSIAMASHLSLFLAAGVLMIRGKLNAGDFLILGSAMGAILARLQQVATINEQYQNAIVSARRLFEILMAPPSVPEKPDARPLPPGSGTIRFEKVTFGYNPLKPVLKEIDFEIPGGSSVALVGPTGAGKSTLVNLLARFYDPQQGRILIDGQDLRDTTLASVRTQVAFVFQETYLFSDTIEANIAYGRPGVSGGAVEAAARLAQAHDFIEAMPKGYQTILSERGSSLSGGQRQRIAIARAIVADPRILVLDDATAAVDPETEDLIRRGLNVVLRGHTTFVIAHRISTVKRADLVLVIEDGRITQMGKHADLMAEDGHYRDIAAVQLYGEDVRAPDEEQPSHMDRMLDKTAVGAAVVKPSEEGPIAESGANP